MYKPRMYKFGVRMGKFIEMIFVSGFQFMSFLKVYIDICLVSLTMSQRMIECRLLLVR